LLYLLKGSAEACSGLVFGGHSNRFVTEAPGGDWTFEVPLEFAVPDLSHGARLVHMNSIDFDLARSDVGAFTFGLPVYWAIVLAVPGIRRGLRPLILGTLAMAFVEIVLLLIFVEIFAHQTAAQLSQSQDGVSSWLLHFGKYLVVNVIPYAIPFLIAIWLHRELRAQIFHWETAAPLPAEGLTSTLGNFGARTKKRTHQRN
jgi:hypothetical protein